MSALLAAPLTLFDPPNTQKIADLRAQLAALPRLSSKVQRTYRLSELPTVIEALDPARDTWISQAEFCKPNRRIVHLLRLSLCFVDLDTYKTPFKGESPEALDRRVRGYCLDEWNLPLPSLILYSGRGLQVKWLLERPLPRAALPRWNAVQKQLVTNLEPFGADPGARDASRLLRLVDTVNTRSGERVRVLWVNEQTETFNATILNCSPKRFSPKTARTSGKSGKPKKNVAGCASRLFPAARPANSAPSQADNWPGIAWKTCERWPACGAG